MIHTRKALFSSELGKIASEVLLRDAVVTKTHGITNLKGPLSLQSINQSTTDKWLREAISTPKSQNSGVNNVVLYLPTVLKTLQRLRSNDRRASYFALLNKIKYTQIKWLSNSGKPIKDDRSAPLEFYHEASTMLYRLSLTTQDSLLIDALTRFTFEFMRDYQSLLTTKSNRHVGQMTKFYKNCILLTVKLGSIAHLLETLRLIPAERAGLKLLAELAFYQQSLQTFKALDLLEQKILINEAPRLRREEVIEFFPVLFSIMQSSILNGSEDTCCNLLEKLSKDWKYDMSIHDYTILKNLSERYANNTILIALEKYYPNYSSPIIPWRTLQSKLGWGQYMMCLYEMKADLFREEQSLDFLQLKLSSVGLKISEWIDFLEEMRIPDNANESVKAFAVQSILSGLVANRNIGFVIPILEYMIYKMDYAEHFLNTVKLAGQYKCSSFHLLFKAISNSSSSILTANLLLKFLIQETHLGFSFNTNDFYFMMKACGTGTNHHGIYYFLFHYILILGHTLYEEAGAKTTWSLPSQIKMLLENYLTRSRGDKNALGIMFDVENWFIQAKSTNKYVRIDEETLKDMFGDLYIAELNLNTLLSFEKKSELTSNEEARLVYSPSVDMLLCERLNPLLKFISDSARN